MTWGKSCGPARGRRRWGRVAPGHAACRGRARGPPRARGRLGAGRAPGRAWRLRHASCPGGCGRGAAARARDSRWADPAGESWGRGRPPSPAKPGRPGSVAGVGHSFIPPTPTLNTPAQAARAGQAAWLAGSVYPPGVSRPSQTGASGGSHQRLAVWW
jgi:hypothetical protein